VYYVYAIDEVFQRRSPSITEGVQTRVHHEAERVQRPIRTLALCVLGCTNDDRDGISFHFSRIYDEMPICQMIGSALYKLRDGLVKRSIAHPNEYMRRRTLKGGVRRLAAVVILPG
jgi:hypothetical protein